VQVWFMVREMTHHTMTRAPLHSLKTRLDQLSPLSLTHHYHLYLVRYGHTRRAPSQILPRALRVLSPPIPPRPGSRRGQRAQAHPTPATLPFPNHIQLLPIYRQQQPRESIRSDARIFAPPRRFGASATVCWITRGSWGIYHTEGDRECWLQGSACCC